MRVLRALVEKMARAGASLDLIERTVADQARRQPQGELSAAERMRLSKERWARENLVGDHDDARVDRAERWLGWDVAPPATDAWLFQRDDGDAGWLTVYNTPARQMPSERLREHGLDLGDAG